MRRGRREEGGEERRGLNKCEWVQADLTADLQEPLVPARARPNKKIGRRGVGIFFGGARLFFGRVFGGERVFLVRAPPIFGKSGEHIFFPRADCRRDAGDSWSHARRRTPRGSG